MRELRDIENDIYAYYDKYGTFTGIDSELALEYLEKIGELEKKDWKKFDVTDASKYKYATIMSSFV